MRAVDRLAVGVGGGGEVRVGDPAVLPGDLLGDRHRQVLGALDGAHELAGLVEALHGAGVEPRVAAAEGHHVELAGFEVHPVEVGDLELAARRGAHEGGARRDVAGVEVQAGHGVGAAGPLGLLLDGQGAALRVELDDAEALGVVHVVAEHGGAARRGRLGGAPQVAPQAVAVEDVVAEHERAGLARDPGLPYREGLRQAVGRGLLGVGERHAEARAVAQQPLEVREVGGGGDEQDVPDPGEHEGRQRVVDHRLVVDRQQLLARDERERVQAGAGSAGEDDALH